MNEKYQQLKTHILHDYPELTWEEMQSEKENAYLDLNKDGSGGIGVLYQDANNMPFYAILHEVGHWISFRNGFMTQAVKDAATYFHRLKIRTHDISQVVYEEELRAWKFGREYGEKYGLFLDEEDLQKMEKALAMYRKYL